MTRFNELMLQFDKTEWNELGVKSKYSVYTRYIVFK